MEQRPAEADLSPAKLVSGLPGYHQDFIGVGPGPSHGIGREIDRAMTDNILVLSADE